MKWLAASKADAVLITLPPFAQMGSLKKPPSRKHIFIEKPIALTPEQGLSMTKAAKEANIITSVGFHMRQGAVYRTITVSGTEA